MYKDLDVCPNVLVCYIPLKEHVQSKGESDNANPSGVFFPLFLRSFILLRELECVVEPPWSEAVQKATNGVRGGLPFCNTHASMV